MCAFPRYLTLMKEARNGNSVQEHIEFEAPNMLYVGGSGVDTKLVSRFDWLARAWPSRPHWWKSRREIQRGCAPNYSESVLPAALTSFMDSGT